MRNVVSGMEYVSDSHFTLMVLRYQESGGYEQRAEEQKEVIAERFPDLAFFSVETEHRISDYRGSDGICNLFDGNGDCRYDSDCIYQ